MVHRSFFRRDTDGGGLGRFTPGLTAELIFVYFRFISHAITDSATRPRRLRNRQKFQRSQLTELSSTGFKSWAKESYEIATEIAYLNGRLIGAPRDGNTDCTTVAAAPALPAGYVHTASRIADRRMILAGYRLADLLRRITQNFH